MQCNLAFQAHSKSNHKLSSPEGQTSALRQLPAHADVMKHNRAVYTPVAIKSAGTGPASAVPTDLLFMHPMVADQCEVLFPVLRREDANSSAQFDTERPEPCEP